jgi:hypothetical protein
LSQDSRIIQAEENNSTHENSFEFGKAENEIGKKYLTGLSMLTCTYEGISKIQITNMVDI